MAIKTDEDLKNIFEDLIEDVLKSVSQRAKKLLQERINQDTYGINKTQTGNPKINKYYLSGTGVPSYEFRDKAWDMRLEKDLFCLFYDALKMSAPSSVFPFLHGNNDIGEDRRNELAEILNVSGIAENGDFYTDKKREPFWDNFMKELKDKLGSWLYTEFNNRGLKIPDLKNAKFG